MARRTRRRPGVVWLPMSIENRMSTDNPLIGQSCGFGQYAISVTGRAPGAHVENIFPVVADQPQLVEALGQSLASQEKSAYRLRRIVGKIFVEYDTQAGSTFVTGSVIVTVGFIILEVERSLAFQPKSSLSTDYSAVSLENIADPWIWRRSWIVGSSSTTSPGAGITRPLDGSFSFAPQNNFTTYGGGVLDGPHIDAKTSRTVRDEQRLAMVISCTNQSPDSGVGGLPAIIVTTDLRVLASMKNTSGNRRNASR